MGACRTAPGSPADSEECFFGPKGRPAASPSGYQPLERAAPARRGCRRTLAGLRRAIPASVSSRARRALSDRAVAPGVGGATLLRRFAMLEILSHAVPGRDPGLYRWWSSSLREAVEGHACQISRTVIRAVMPDVASAPEGQAPGAEASRLSATGPWTGGACPATAGRRPLHLAADRRSR